MNSMFAIFTNAVYNDLQIYLNFVKYNLHFLKIHGYNVRQAIKRVHAMHELNVAEHKKLFMQPG